MSTELLLSLGALIVAIVWAANSAAFLHDVHTPTAPNDCMAILIQVFQNSSQALSFLAPRHFHGRRLRRHTSSRLRHATHF